jgi:hypothetical protein
LDQSSITITVPEACRIGGWSETTGRDLCRRGLLVGAFRLPGSRRWLVHREVFLDGLERLALGQTLEQFHASDQVLYRRSLDELRGARLDDRLSVGKPSHFGALRRVNHVRCCAW